MDLLGKLLTPLLLLLLLISLARCEQEWEETTTSRPLVPIRPRIVGGRRASAGQFGHQVSLRYFGHHICGGSIISASYVLTAAHCVQFGQDVTDPSRLAVQAGSLRLNSYAVYVDVAAIKVHPQYLNGGQGYDIALLRLARPLGLNANIVAIPLAEKDPPPDAVVHISGWGAIYHGGPTSNDLLYVQVRSIARSECTSRYMRRLPSTTMCLLHGANLGACHGDSGGPAVHEGRLVGVASFVLGACGREAPDGYESIATLRSWIISNSDL
ncbi:PREDICTED: serine protease SP24D [Drosophila arizonae]|uniref:trypsin n=1 Tax=Drosophila arizonae TaxID=7263 RepID=A0ABM1PT87_DROAR|nr:PREDICTED: serine protease SP24D [Drosophila arizonae]